MKLEDLNKDILWKEYGIIPNKIYSIWTEEDFVLGKVLNFDSNQFALNTTRGFAIIKRTDIEEMKVSDMTEERFIEKQNETLTLMGFEE